MVLPRYTNGVRTTHAPLHPHIDAGPLLTAFTTTPSDPSASSRESTSPQASASGEQMDWITQSLLGYAASDFRAHSPSVAQVRNARVGHVDCQGPEAVLGMR
jgi:hypothetical protein